MRPMIWHPEEKDQKVNRYLDSTTRAPYFWIDACCPRYFLFIYFYSFSRNFLTKFSLR
jgi:hypothetical protein